MMKMMNKISRKYWIFPASAVGVVLVAALALMPWLKPLATLRFEVGILVTFFLPGLIWSFFFWSPAKTSILERLIFSVILSVAGVTIGVYYLNRLGRPIDANHTAIVVGVLAVLGVAAILLKRFAGQVRGSNPHQT